MLHLLHGFMAANPTDNHNSDFADPNDNHNPDFEFMIFGTFAVFRLVCYCCGYSVLGPWKYRMLNGLLENSVQSTRLFRKGRRPTIGDRECLISYYRKAVCWIELVSHRLFPPRAREIASTRA